MCIRDRWTTGRRQRPVGGLFSLPSITVARAEGLLGGTRSTTHEAIDALVERVDLVEVTGRRRGGSMRRRGSSTRSAARCRWPRMKPIYQLPLDVGSGG